MYALILVFQGMPGGAGSSSEAEAWRKTNKAIYEKLVALSSGQVGMTCRIPGLPCPALPCPTCLSAVPSALPPAPPCLSGCFVFGWLPVLG